MFEQRSTKQLQLSIQSCQNCYKHPQQNHTQVDFISKINQIYTQLTRSWKYSNVVIKKNQKIEKSSTRIQGSVRVSAFQVKFKKLLIYSKLCHGGFPRVHDIVTMVMALVSRQRYQIEKIRNKIGDKDLYTYLKSRTHNVKLSLKFTVNQIDKIMILNHQQKQKQISSVTLNISKHLQNKQNTNEGQKQQKQQKIHRNALTATSRNRNSKYTNHKSIKRIDSLKSQFNKSKKQFPTESQQVQVTSTIFKGILKQPSKNSMLENKIGSNSKQLRKFSSMLGKQDQSKKIIQKYTYLSKDVDKIDLRKSQKDGDYQYNNNGKDKEKEKDRGDEQFQLLQLSNQEQQQQIEQQDQDDEWNEQKILQRKIQQGLTFNLTASYTQRKGSRKYSFQFKKFAQLLCMQLKQDQNLNQQIFKQSSTSVFKKAGFVIDQNQNTSNQSSNQDMLNNPLKLGFGIQTEKLLASKHVIVTPDQDDIIKQDMEMGNQGKLEQPDVDKLSEKGISIEDISSCQENDNQENKYQTSQKTYKNLKSTKKIIEPKINYQLDFVHNKIQGIISQREQIQIFIDVHYLSSLQKLSKVILNVHNISPQYFEQVLQNRNFQEIQLSTNPSFCQVVLFNPILGFFQRIKLKIELSCAYEGDISFWVLVICQCIQIILQNNEKNLFDILRILTGAPIVKISAVDLRKVKKIIVDSYFANQEGKKGRILCIQSNQTQNNEDQKGHLNYCQMIGLQKKKDFLQSIVSYRELISKNSENIQQITTKVYEQFVLQYQNLMLWFYEDKYSHNQQIYKFHKQIQQKKQNQNEDQIDMRQIIKQKGLSWKIQFQIFEHSQVFLQFTEHEKVQKTNHILISKLFKKGKKNGIEPVGELNKKGNFFFELSLQAGSYIVQINRTFDNQQSNSIHFYSSNPLKINKSTINDKSLQQFIQYSDHLQTQQ